MKISVAIPTFNAEKFILPLLASIQDQSVQPDEVVLSDDSSSDSTLQLIDQFAGNSAIRFVVLQHQPAGISANYRNALLATSGDVVIMGDHDDIWLPNKIARLRQSFIENPGVSLISSDSEIVDENACSLGTTLRGGARASHKLAEQAAKDDFRLFLIGARLDAHTLAFRAAIRTILGQANLSTGPGFWFENQACAAALSMGRLLYLPEALNLYRQHPQQHVGYQAPPLLPSLGKRDIAGKLQELTALETWLDQHPSISLLPEAETRRRLDLLRAYRNFVSGRECDVSTLTFIAQSVKALLRKDYYRFTRRPLRSFGRDVFHSLL